MVLPAERTVADGWLPTYANFVKASSRGKRSAGYEGWTARELKVAASTFPFLTRELYDLRVATTRCLGTQSMTRLADCPQQVRELQELLFSWRVVGVPKKCERQEWHLGEQKKIEHIGIEAAPDNPAIPTTPAGRWKKLYAAIETLRSIPGSSKTRLRAVEAYVKPLWLWCTPVFVAPPTDMASKLMSAILRTRCTWWCRGRLWALHIGHHPLYSSLMTSIQRLTDWDLEMNLWTENNSRDLFKHVGLAKLLCLCYYREDAQKGSCKGNSKEGCSKRRCAFQTPEGPLAHITCFGGPPSARAPSARAPAARAPSRPSARSRPPDQHGASGCGRGHAARKICLFEDTVRGRRCKFGERCHDKHLDTCLEADFNEFTQASARHPRRQEHCPGGAAEPRAAREGSRRREGSRAAGDRWRAGAEQGGRTRTAPAAQPGAVPRSGAE
ncbi:unnamed protein product, partial [Prorocentrum cordatum]